MKKILRQLSGLIPGTPRIEVGTIVRAAAQALVREFGAQAEAEADRRSRAGSLARDTTDHYWRIVRIYLMQRRQFPGRPDDVYDDRKKANWPPVSRPGADTSPDVDLTGLDLDFGGGHFGGETAEEKERKTREAWDAVRARTDKFLKGLGEKGGGSE
jgi:hypothetical protein